MGRTPLRAILYGCGNMAWEYYRATKELSDIIDVIAIVGKHKEVTQKKIASHYGDNILFSDNYEEAVKHLRPDFAIICNQPEKMYEAQCKSIHLGVPFLTEKPPALSLSEIENLMELVTIKKILHGVGFNRRYYPHVAWLKDQIDEGKEEILSFSVRTSENISATKKRFPHRSDVALNVIHFLNSIHLVDLLIYLCGDLKVAYSDIISHQECKIINTILKKGNILSGSYQNLVNIPKPYAVEFITKHKIFTLSPIEQMKTKCILSGKEITFVSNSYDSKLGLVSMLKDFVSQIQNPVNESFANYQQAHKAMSLCREIFKQSK